MNILYIANIRMPTERAHGAQIMKMCEAFVALGHEVTLVVPTRKTHISEDPFEYYGLANRFKIVRLSTPDTVSWGRLGFWIEQCWFAETATLYAVGSKADLIYGRDELPLMCISAFKKNVVWEAHLPRWGMYVRMLTKRVKKIITISGGLQDWYVAKGMPKEKIIVAHDGYDPEQFKNPISKHAARNLLALPQDAFIAMYIGSLEEWKGYRTFLEASKNTSEVLFVVIGGKKEQIETLKKEYPNVTFLGEKMYKDLADNQQAADVLVIPNTAKDSTSAIFTSPLKAFAHLASNVPIIASDVASLREICTEEMVSFVTPDNPEQLSRMVRDIQSSYTSALKQAEFRRQDVIEVYAWKHRARAVLQALM